MWHFSKGVCVSSLRVQRNSPPPLPSFLSKGKVGRKGETNSHWPQADATALREGKMHKKPPIFTDGEGKGEGGFPLIPPGIRHPSEQAPRPGSEVSAPCPGVRSPQQLCCSSSSFKAATVVWLRRGEARRGKARRGEDSLGRARRRLRPGTPGFWSPSPTSNLVGGVRGPGAQ